MRFHILIPLIIAISVISKSGCKNSPSGPGNSSPPYQIVFSKAYKRLHVTNLDGTEQRFLHRGFGWPRWSPKGDKIAFFGYYKDEPGYFLSTIKPDSSDFQAITLAVREGETLTGSLDWSPDGEKLVFFTTKYHATGFAVINADGTGEMNLTPRGFWRVAIWSPDGSKIALEGAPSGSNIPSIYVINADGTEMSRLVDDFSGSTYWSPDGNRIAFIMPARQTYSPNIYIVDVDGSNLHRVTSDDNSGISDWSPDGKKILYLFVPEGAVNLSVVSVGIMNVDGSDRKTLVEGDANHMNLLAKFSADGSKVAYVRNSKTGTEDLSALWVMNADGSNKRKLHGHTEPVLIYYDWSPKLK